MFRRTFLLLAGAAGLLMAQSGRIGKGGRGRPGRTDVVVEGDTITVGSTGCDYTNLQTAINAAILGDTITLKSPESFTGNFELPDKGAGTSFITIRSDNTSTYPAVGVRVTTANTGMAKIVTNNSIQPIFAQPFAHHYKFVGVEIHTSYTASESFYLYADGYTSVGLSTQTSNLANIAHHIEFDRCWFHGTTTNNLRHGIAFNGAYEVLRNSLMTEVHSTEGDATGVGGHNGPGPYDIINNRIEASGESIIFGGANSGISGVQPADFTIQYNYLTKPLAWNPSHPSYDSSTWVCKNVWEMKTGVRILFDHNICEHSWTPHQDGNIVLLQLMNQPAGGNTWNKLEDITVTNNIFRHGNRGVVLAGHVLFGGSSLDFDANSITFQNNLFYGIDGSIWGLGGSDNQYGHVGGLGGPIPDLSFIHNTIDNTNGVSLPYGIQLGSIGSSFTNLLFKDNFWRSKAGAYGALYADGNVGTAALNAYAPGPTWTFLNNVISDDTGGTYPTTTVKLTESAIIALWPNRASADYTLTPGGTYAAGGANDASDGTDVGVNMLLLPDPAGDGLTTFTP